ncbi:MAG: hypothetical protein A3G25_13405 [Betaproteobacteria bacterium RIFCSPLOWO2_12_FULL_63_13]|nr:MAG: hypothetical protein A3G25_13405 [Betaproteobacteria bacterium RIFCSPLOWO2_12_FULL_63_13]
MLKAEDLIGVYAGRGQDHLAKDGTVVQLQKPAGPDQARIAYTKEGMVIVVSTPAGRPKVDAGIPDHATVDEKARMADGVVAYAGRYEIKGDAVIHHIDVSFFPNLVGSANVRIPTFQGKLLTLTTEPDEKGGVRRIHWERLDEA